MMGTQLVRAGTRGDRASRVASLLVGIVLLAATACSEEAAPGPAPVPTPDGPAEDWCERVAAGPVGATPGPVAMSEAHALMRFFGVGSSYAEVDQALALALIGDTVDWDAAAVSYAEQLQPVCALDAVPRPLPVARVEQVGGVAVIHPGTGELVLPDSVQAVAIDLRGLPADPLLEQALARAIAVASTQPVPRVATRVRAHQGMTDERAVRAGVYSNDLVKRVSPPFEPAGKRELPVALLTGSTLAPVAARFAVDLRLAQRAWIFGESLPTAVAEYRWAPVGTRGLAIRTEVLVDDRGTLPDVIAADRPLGDSLEALLGELANLGTAPAVARDAKVTRPALTGRSGSDSPTPPMEASPGVARADLLIAHSALRRFFPYFHVVGDGIDERLRQSLAEVDAGPMDWRRLGHVLQRFGEVLHDGHVSVGLRESIYAGYFLVVPESVGGEVVVRRSAVPQVKPGDTLVSINGRPVAEWLAEEVPRTSGSHPGAQLSRALQRLTWLDGPTQFGVRALDGSTSSVLVSPSSLASRTEFGSAPSARRAGRLTDLGVPGIAYINLADSVLSDLEVFRQSVQEAVGARGLILDMRGYPGVDPYHALRHLIPQAFKSPFFRVPHWSGPDHLEMTEDQYSLTPDSRLLFEQPIVLLTGPGAVSAAENLSMMLVGAKRVRVVGRRSVGTNGNITRLWLPGGVTFVFTGMEVLFPDRSPLHGVGIVPDVEVQPTAEDFAAGRDPELLKAIELLVTEG
ncbi:S41 family peptidase [Hyalangium gracile]|uniref:S41 family peptidase n=1 Tax=Hyalangium gracile TaxID=394092 RepID=UPI001CCBFCB3|nr:S41 family peptidase [Hyalangium gracile]